MFRRIVGERDRTIAVRPLTFTRSVAAWQAAAGCKRATCGTYRSRGGSISRRSRQRKRHDRKFGKTKHGYSPDFSGIGNFELRADRSWWRRGRPAFKALQRSTLGFEGSHSTDRLRRYDGHHRGQRQATAPARSARGHCHVRAARRIVGAHAYIRRCDPRIRRDRRQRADQQTDDQQEGAQESDRRLLIPVMPNSPETVVGYTFQINPASGLDGSA